MAEHEERQQRIKRLLAQDPAINDTHMKEFRMQLEQSLEASEAKAKQTRRRILIAWLIYMAVMLVNVALPTQWRNATVDPQMMRFQEMLFVPLTFLTILVMVIGVLLVILYLFKYQPRLGRARFDLQTSMLLELQEQVKELRENFERKRD